MNVTLTAQKMVTGGHCLAVLDGKNILIPYTIPGETVEAEIIKENRDYSFARLIRVIEPSPHRVEPVCPHYGICGGCNMQHISPQYQSELRKQILKDCFEREGIKVPEITVLESSPLNYRARIQLTDGGFCKKSSNEIIRLDNCPVATDEINAYLKSTPQNERPRGRVHLFGDSRITGDKNTFIADEITSGAKDQRKTYRKNSGKIIKNRIPNHFAGTVFSPQNTCELKLLDKNVKFNVQGFFQSNMQLLEKTIAEVTYNLSGKNVLDMYAGSGTFSVFLADKFEKTTLVEHNRDALVYAEANMNGKNHETYGLSGEKWCKEHASLITGRNGPFDAAVIDPPRSGMEKEVCRWLCISKVFQLRSVSCDPATHARDASFLIKSGYTLKRLYLLDFYPQTSHIESLAYFENEN